MGAGTEPLEIGQPYPWVYADGEFVRAGDARLSVLASVVSYGTGTYEGIRATWHESRQELYLLQAEAHFERLARSARILGLELPHPVPDLVALARELLRKNRVRDDAYLRPLLLLAGEQLVPQMHDGGTRLLMAATPLPSDLVLFFPQGVRCMVSTWRRAPDIAVPSRAKLIGNYVGPSLAKTEAIRRGFDEALMLTADGHVAEATTANIILRNGAEWATPPVTDDILEGITRRQLIDLLAEDFGVTVAQRRIHRSELYTCDEALLCGTAVIVLPVTQVDGRPVGDGNPGAITLALQRTLRAIARRDDDRRPEWTTSVYADQPG